jgi:hypothetical protein
MLCARKKQQKCTLFRGSAFFAVGRRNVRDPFGTQRKKPSKAVRLCVFFAFVCALIA